MIHFGHITHKVMIDTLTQSDAKDYIDFLLIERERHENEVKTCYNIISVLQSGDTGCSRVTPLLWESAIKRHLEDVVSCDEVIEKVKRKFNV